MKLYSLPLSPYAARVRGAIHAKKLDVEIVPPPADRSSPELRALNPAGRIPILVLDDGTALPRGRRASRRCKPIRPAAICGTPPAR